jgi:thiol-disulfide isomerase/thioredoxin
MRSDAVSTFDADHTTIDAQLEGAHGDLVVVEFWGPGCPNCDFFEAELPRLLESLRGERVRFVRLNAYAHPDVATRFGLFGIPAFHLYRDGRRLGRMSEYRGRDYFLGVLRDHLPKSQPAASAG